MKENTIRYLIRNAQLVNEGKTFRGSVLTRGEFIDDIITGNSIPDSYIKEKGIKVIEAGGKYLLPGIIDDQVHFREPGLTHKGDLSSESAAAVAGGITSFMEMPNTVPNTISNSLLEEKYTLAYGRSYANHSFYLGATNNNIEEIRNFDPENNCGIKAFLGASTGNMLVDDPQAIEKIFATPFLIAIHSEDENIIRENTLKYRQLYGEQVPFAMHPLIRSREACVASTLRAVGIARRLNTRLHILHLSTADELQLLDNENPLQDKRITSEVCVHHLWFNDSDYEHAGSKIKWNPSIKSEADRSALFGALFNGLIDVIATDHAPHTAAEKQNSYFSAPSGGPLVQHSLPAMMAFCSKGLIGIERIVELMCHNPAICFGIKNRGFLRKNYYADMVLLDPKAITAVSKENILYKCAWSPFEGISFPCSVVTTFVNGHPVWDEGRLAGNASGMRLQFIVRNN